MVEGTGEVPDCSWLAALKTAALGGLAAAATAPCTVPREAESHCSVEVNVRESSLPLLPRGLTFWLMLLEGQQKSQQCFPAPRDMVHVKIHPSCFLAP